ncbi:hypothetical protein [Priestia megaterium]|uniref:hypothetical protein n=1 Tax=Priestia megaterium TaxID=1404 RepID=UPI0011265561|nr:hypothetical protein [Priestia megaterium]
MGKLVQSKKDYIESKLKDLLKDYEVTLMDEFSIKNIFGLEHDFMSLPPDHTKSKKDILDMINSLKTTVDLKKKSQGSFNGHLSNLSGVVINGGQLIIDESGKVTTDKNVARVVDTDNFATYREIRSSSSNLVDLNKIEKELNDDKEITKSLGKDTSKLDKSIDAVQLLKEVVIYKYKYKNKKK